MQCSPSPRAAWNYLRVRGEYIRKLYESRGYEELPPRARRILVLVVMILAAWGTTSACAENTSMSSKKRFPARNYLRVRGEYGPTTPRTRHHLELPPRARRIHQ